MRKIHALIALFVTLPLAACFDAEIDVTVLDKDNAEARIVMTASEEVYQFAVASGEDVCHDGTLETLDDGRYSCTMVVSGTIDEAANSPDIGHALKIERRFGGTIFAAFDRDAALSGLDAPTDFGDPAMLASMADAFAGHGLSVRVTGSIIQESNGQIAPDRKSVSFYVPFDTLLTDPNSLPETFEVLVRPGR